MTLKLGMQHQVHEYYQVCSNDDPGLTLTYFKAFVWEKGKTMDFSEIFVIYDLKLATDDRSDDVFVDIKTLPPGGCMTPAPGL